MAWREGWKSRCLTPREGGRAPGRGWREQESATWLEGEGSGCELRTLRGGVRGAQESLGQADGTGGLWQGRGRPCLHFLLG